MITGTTNGQPENHEHAHDSAARRHAPPRCFCCGAIYDSGDRYCADCVDVGCINDRVGDKCRMVQS